MTAPDTKPPSGTRDFLANEVVRRRHAFERVREVFEAHGFEALETPAFERLEVLLGKSGEDADQLLFKILRRGEHEHTGDADLGLRYDLTVPLARVVAEHAHELPQPYKRYHLAPVWRADRPGRGRFREFVQCDVDVVGAASSLADADVLLAVTGALAALGVRDFDVHVNSRLALRGLVEAYGVPEALEDAVLVTLDKLDKVGVDAVGDELRQRGVDAATVTRLTADLASDDPSTLVREAVATTARGKVGLDEVDEVLELVGDLAPGSVRFAPLLARGLSYYTGPIFEVTTPDSPGSIASGGRYDGLVGMFSGRDVPACGGSVGLERVLLLTADDAATAAPDVLVTVLDEAGRGDALALAQRLRQGGVRTDLFVGSGRLGKQLQYGDRRGIRYCIVRGESERAAATVAIKDLLTGEQTAVPEDSLLDEVRQRLDRA